jgi:hypothetical protein
MMIKKTLTRKRGNHIEDFAIKLTEWVGTPTSIIIHTIVFMTAFLAYFLGASIELVLLVMTTFLSIEAIYLSLFIQFSVNHATQSIEDVEENLWRNSRGRSGA